MAYCKNCGSILAGNANFCHVCGAKVEVSDVFDEPKAEEVEAEKVEEVKEENSFYSGNSGASSQNGGFRSFYDELRMASESNVQENAVRTASRRSFVPGLISMIGSVVVGAEAGLNYLYSIMLANYQYEEGVYAWEDYSASVSSTLITSAVYLIMACILGISLGTVGIIVARKAQQKKGFIFSIIGISVGVICAAIAIVLFILNAKL